MEMLVVIGIIGILAAISLPAMKGMTQANVTAAADRQMLDDLAYARLRAIADHTTVYMVFVPTNVGQLLLDPGFLDDERRVLTNLVTGQYTKYALFAPRTVGDQPGRPTPRYLTEWKTLPEGIMIRPDKLIAPGSFASPGTDPLLSGLRRRSVPFPKVRKVGSQFEFPLPSIAFNEKGQLLLDTSHKDAYLPLVRGSVFYQRDQNGQIVPTSPADVQTIPAVLTTNDFHAVRINWVTGRARIEGPRFADEG